MHYFSPQACSKHRCQLKGNETDHKKIAQEILKAATIAVTPEIARNQFRHRQIRIE
jgi:hypothetical protein